MSSSSSKYHISQSYLCILRALGAFTKYINSSDCPRLADSFLGSIKTASIKLCIIKNSEESQFHFDSPTYLQISRKFNKCQQAQQASIFFKVLRELKDILYTMSITTTRNGNAGSNKSGNQSDDERNIGGDVER